MASGLNDVSESGTGIMRSFGKHGEQLQDVRVHVKYFKKKNGGFINEISCCEIKSVASGASDMKDTNLEEPFLPLRCMYLPRRGRTGASKVYH